MTEQAGLPVDESGETVDLIPAGNEEEENDQKNNPCLIGEPGVGKTAIAEGLAVKIAVRTSGKAPEREIYLLDLTALVAGTQFRGQFESRIKGLIEEVKKPAISFW